MNLIGKNKQLIVKPDDVYLVSYPRSGNTWVRYLLANLLHPTREWNIDNLNRTIPDLHQEIPGDYLESYPRIFKTHCSYSKGYTRAIYVCRDGRDVSISYFDLRKKKGLCKKEFCEFMEEMLRGQLLFGSWQNHVQSWVLDQHQTPLLVIKYEQLYQDTAATIRLIGEYLGLKWSAAEIDLAIRKSTLKKLSNDLFLYKYESHWSKNFRGGVKGAPGKWREVFDKQLNDFFWKFAGEVSAKMGYLKE